MEKMSSHVLLQTPTKRGQQYGHQAALGGGGGSTVRGFISPWTDRVDLLGSVGSLSVRYGTLMGISLTFRIYSLLPQCLRAVM